MDRTSWERKPHRKTPKNQSQKYMKVGKKAVFQVSNPITPVYQGHYGRRHIRPKPVICLCNPETSLHNDYYGTLIEPIEIIIEKFVIFVEIL